MLIRAVYVGYRFFKEALHRVVGIDREASFATTVFATVMLAAPFLNVAALKLKALRQPLPAPSLGGGLLGVALVKQTARAIAGEPEHETPMSDAIIVAALLGPAYRVIMLPVYAVRAALRTLAGVWRYVTQNPLS